MIYEYFLKHLETCGGCIDLRNQTKCRYAVVCAHVEGMVKRREIRNYRDLRNLRNRSWAVMDMKKAPAPTEADKKTSQNDYTTESVLYAL